MHIDDGDSTRRRNQRRRSARCASGFGDADFFHRRAAAGLLARLSLLNIEPGLIVDLGCANGLLGGQLQKRFPRSRLLYVDASLPMLKTGRGPRRRWLSRRRHICADSTATGLRTECADLVCANLLFPRNGLPDETFVEVARVLKPGRAFALSSLGPDSFAEMRSVWGDIGIAGNQPLFPDMHDVGDAMMRAGFADPVLDTERCTIRFADFAALWRDLHRSGSGNPQPSGGGLNGRRLRREFESAWQNRYGSGPLEVSMELVFAHGWMSERAHDREFSREFRVDLSDIRRRKPQ